MFSIKHQFIFIHIPKTGGNSIQNILAPFSDDKIVCKHHLQDGLERFELENDKNGLRKHSSLIDYCRELPADFIRNARIITCIRNPWERMISYYFSPHRGNVAWSKDDFISMLSKEVENSEYYLKSPSNQLRIEYIRFENFIIDFKRTCSSLGIPCNKISHRNKSVHLDYREYYDDELVSIVAEKSAFEINKFGYSFNS